MTNPNTEALREALAGARKDIDNCLAELRHKREVIKQREDLIEKQEDLIKKQDILIEELRRIIRRKPDDD